MKKILDVLDYYYLVLLRGLGRRLDYKVIAVMQVTLTFNLFSLIILIYPYFLKSVFFMICIIILGFLLMIILDIRYNKKRRERIIIQYKRENRESRQRGVVRVVVYEVLSFAFLVLAFSISIQFIKP